MVVAPSLRLKSFPSGVVSLCYLICDGGGAVCLDRHVGSYYNPDRRTSRGGSRDFGEMLVLGREGPAT